MTFFRRLTIDVPVFLTVAIIIVLLNAGQYFMGYGGFGFVGEPEAPGLTLGFPFAYYYYPFSVYEGEMVYLGIIGNLLFANGLGILAGVLAGFIRRLRISGS
ncbi:MAG: hypothetical protein AB7J13_05165 [Pyrinomonadaceae bacterium]